MMSILLLGLVVAAMLTLLRVTVVASSTEREHANAHAWLQTATDVLYGYERLDCGTATASLAASMRLEYEGEIRAVAVSPEGWTADNIHVVGPVQFWDGETYQDVCHDDDNINLQLITIEVRDTDGEVVESVEVVKG